MRIPACRIKGFSLLELSLVVTILALLMAGILNVATQRIMAGKQAELVMKMDAIEAALLAFRKANKRLPCPALGSAPAGTTFGVEDSHPGSCSGAAFTSADTFTVGGVVPTRTLALPDDYMFDPWGNRFTYAVDNRMTTSSPTPAFTLYSSTDSSVGSITVKQSTTAVTPMTSKAIAIVLSHGPNGHGAFQLSGVRKNFGSTNLDEQKNCHCTSAAAAATFDSTFIQSTGHESSTDTGFDDTLRYYLRSDFLSGTELLIEK